jgi:hypothetical protein
MNTTLDSKLPPILTSRNPSPPKQVSSDPFSQTRRFSKEPEKKVTSKEINSPNKWEFSAAHESSTSRLESSFVSSFPLISSTSKLPVLAVNKSTDVIKKNIRNSYLNTNENRVYAIKAKNRKKELFRNLSKETKIIIQAEKQEKILKMINRKFNKSEIQKNRHEKVAFSKVFMTFVGVFGYCFQIVNRFERVKMYKRKIHKYLFSVAVVCKALGKFFRSLSRVKYLISIRKIQKLMPRFIRRYKIWMYETYTARILGAVDNFVKHGSISRVNFIINYQIKLIQRTIRSFLVIMKHRKFVLRNMWIQLNKGEKVFETIQHYYISKYINEKIKSFLKEKSKLIKFNTFLTSDFKRNTDFFEIFDTDELYPTVFRIFKKKAVKKLIEKAKREKNDWKQIRFPRFPLIITAKEENRSRTNSILKTRRTSRPRKVTFK